MTSLRPPDYDERILLLGSNGTGKSYLARELLGAGYRRWNALDWKGDFEPIGTDYVLTKDPPWENGRAWKQDRVLYRPKRGDLRSSRSMDGVLRWLFERAQNEYDQRRRRARKPRIVYVDEGYRLGRNQNIQGLSDLAVAGRALGVGLWVGSQRPRWIPVEVRSEAWRWYLFWLSYEEDEKEVLRHAKGQIDLEQLESGWQNHSFWELARREDERGRLSVQLTHFPPIVPTPFLKELEARGR